MGAQEESFHVMVMYSIGFLFIPLKGKMYTWIPEVLF